MIDQTTIKISKNLHSMIKLHSKKSGVKMSSIVDFAVKDYLSKTEPKSSNHGDKKGN